MWMFKKSPFQIRGKLQLLAESHHDECPCDACKWNAEERAERQRRVAEREERRREAMELVETNPIAKEMADENGALRRALEQQLARGAVGRGTVGELAVITVLVSFFGVDPILL